MNRPIHVSDANFQKAVLDSTVPGSIGGQFSEAALERLDQCLRQSADRNIALALHHQPVPVG